jgi:hypothetical protein
MNGQAEISEVPRGLISTSRYGRLRHRSASLSAHFVEVVQEPTEQTNGVRDCAVRDPADNLIRIETLS